MIDTTGLLGNVDLLKLIQGDVDLRKVGREWHGPCPFCSCSSSERGHRCDRFRLSAERSRWYCRHCQPKGGDAISYLMQRDNLTFPEACTALGAPEGIAARPKVERFQPATAEPPPSHVWQDRAAAYVVETANSLWQPGGESALAYLRSQRGLTDATIENWWFGYQPADTYEAGEKWGLDHDVWLPRGVVIPWSEDGQCWGIKIRRAVRSGDKHKYHAVSSSQLAIAFGGHTIQSHKPAFILESELDVVLFEQEAGDLAGAVSLNGTRTCFTMRQLLTLRKCHPIWAGYDADAKGREAMRQVLAMGNRFRATTWPDGCKDLCDVWQGGHNPRAWAHAQMGIP